MAEVEARVVMDNCIDTIKRGDGRTVLHTADQEPIGNLETTSNKPRDLELIMDLLQYKEDRVSYDQRKYVLQRGAAMSYVYLASAKAV